MRDPRPLLVAYGRLAREEREERGWTQAVVAERADLRVRHLRDIEHGRANPDIGALERLARLGLKRRFSDLLAAAEKEIAAGSTGSETTARRPRRAAS